MRRALVWDALQGVDLRDVSDRAVDSHSKTASPGAGRGSKWLRAFWAKSREAVP